MQTTNFPYIASNLRFQYNNRGRRHIKKTILYFICAFITVFIFAGCKTAPKTPEPKKKYALVIGINHYGYTNLKNAMNDAEDMSKILTEFGYQVDVCFDVNLAEMETKIDAFIENLSQRTDSEGFFYFAGYGARINGKNYMVPRGANASTPEQLVPRSYELGKLFGKLIEADNAVNVVISDACFSNIATEQRATASDGLELIEQFTNDILYMQSALPGKDAVDGKGRNSPFTQALLENLPKKTGFAALVQDIINDTLVNSNKRQQPYFKANVCKYEDYAVNN